MAKEAKPVVAAEAAPKKSGKKLLIVIIVLLLFVIVAGGAGALLLMNRQHAEDADEEEVVEPVKTKKKSSKPSPPVYVAMDAFTVNLVPESGDQFIQVILSVEVVDAESGEQIKVYTPKIRNNVMLLLSSKKASELLTKEGKEKLAEEIRDQMNQVLDPRARGDDAPVKEVLFTSFIIQ
ncbi:MAG: flagellar basal body-associated protein FliL [Candidatus Accumulibacter sp.]|jgi:flagellar FliL protein|nr:flagellar basal body-associated protein FliL [Accumulibacter sp.]